MDNPVTYTLADLLHLMSCLRDQDRGCPWDIKQDFSTIVPHTIEEAYEVADAIERGDFDHLKDELGDLLFQVVFYGQLAKEEAYFDFSQVVDGIVKKLLRRHPHVFPSGTLSSFSEERPELTDAEIKANWEAIKSQERKDKGEEAASAMKSALDDIPQSLPALTRANKIQKRAASIGFDWQELPPVIEKLKEEIAELEEAIAEGNKAAVQEEMGDLLFSSVNLARHLGLDPETNLREASQKFEGRFRTLENNVHNSGKKVSELNLEELDMAWEYVKANQ